MVEISTSRSDTVREISAEEDKQRRDAAIAKHDAKIAKNVRR